MVARRWACLALFATGVACGSSSGPGPTDGGREAGPDARQDTGLDTGRDGAVDSSPPGDSPADAKDSAAKDSPAEARTDSGSKLYDGTTGQPCTVDSDCQPAGGPGIARCSSTVFAPNDLYPTPVCILPGCSTPSGTTIHFCDGPDDPSSPGICDSSVTGTGLCLPKCAYDNTGDRPTGCQGKDTCFTLSEAPESGVGYCWAACAANTDCQTGQKCETNFGLCVATVMPPTKKFGAACTSADSSSGACLCFAGSGAGYCSNVCTVGGAACPDGATCDAVLSLGAGYTQQNVGMGGFCVLTCGADGGTEGGASCPTGIPCVTYDVAGPDCLPP